MSENERKVLLFIDGFLKKYGFMPPRTAIRLGCRLSYSHMLEVLRQLQDRGYYDAAFGKSDSRLTRLLVDVADVCGDSVADKAVS